MPYCPLCVVQILRILGRDSRDVERDPELRELRTNLQGFTETLMDLGSLLDPTPASSVLFAARDLLRGDYVGLGFDAFSMIPAVGENVKLVRIAHNFPHYAMCLRRTRDLVVHLRHTGHHPELVNSIQRIGMPLQHTLSSVTRFWPVLRPMMAHAQVPDGVLRRVDGVLVGMCEDSREIAGMGLRDSMVQAGSRQRARAVQEAIWARESHLRNGHGPQ